MDSVYFMTNKILYSINICDRDWILKVIKMWLNDLGISLRSNCFPNECTVVGILVIFGGKIFNIFLLYFSATCRIMNACIVSQNHVKISNIYSTLYIPVSVRRALNLLLLLPKLFKYFWNQNSVWNILSNYYIQYIIQRIFFQFLFLKRWQLS